MIRAAFFAAGLFVTIWGVSFLFVDQIVLNVKVKEDKKKEEQGFRGLLSRVTKPNEKQQKVFDPPEWASFSLMSIGAVTMLYSAALPRRHGHGH